MKNCGFSLARSCGNAVVQSCSRAAARTHARTHNASCLYFTKFGKNDFSLKKIFGKKATINIWHFEHKRLKDSAAVGA